MPQSAEEIFALHRARTGAPDLGFVEWSAFPWAAEAGQVVAKDLEPPAGADRARGGEGGGRGCRRCEHPDCRSVVDGLSAPRISLRST